MPTHKYFAGPVFSYSMNHGLKKEWAHSHPTSFYDHAAEFYDAARGTSARPTSAKPSLQEQRGRAGFFFRVSCSQSRQASSHPQPCCLQEKVAPFYLSSVLLGIESPQGFHALCSCQRVGPQAFSCINMQNSKTVNRDTDHCWATNHPGSKQFYRVALPLWGLYTRTSTDPCHEPQKLPFPWEGLPTSNSCSVQEPSALLSFAIPSHCSTFFQLRFATGRCQSPPQFPVWGIGCIYRFLG